jgi:hypothetical protein
LCLSGDTFVVQCMLAPLCVEKLKVSNTLTNNILRMG